MARVFKRPAAKEDRTVGSMPDSLAEIRPARQAGPFSPVIGAEVGMFCAYGRQCRRAIEELQRIRQSLPFQARGACLGARVCFLAGRPAEARAETGAEPRESIGQYPPGAGRSARRCGGGNHIGRREVIAFEQQRLGRTAGEAVRDAVAKVQPGGVPALPITAEGGARGLELRCVERDHHSAGFGKKEIEVRAGVGAESAFENHGRFQDGGG